MPTCWTDSHTAHQEASIPPIDINRELLVTDFYQLTMVDAYLRTGMTGRAVFEFFVRKLPQGRNFLLAAGLEQVVDFLMSARCGAGLLGDVAEQAELSAATRGFLRDFHFSGDVDAVPEGTPVFGDEPLIRVSAPLPEAQIVETRLINYLQYQTLVASKAARMVHAAGGRTLIDFGLRRAHSGEAGLLASRAAAIAGFASSAAVPVNTLFGVPVTGTMAHSFVQAHLSEEAAFLAFARARPQNAVFLIDTYDTVRAAKTVVRIAPQLEREGVPVRGVRIDSGDLLVLSREVRRILDGGGLRHTRIIASGGIDEEQIARLAAANAPIDAFGVGTSLVTSEDAPSLDCAYKLKAYEGRPLRKQSKGKGYWPGPTQIYRHYADDGTIERDRLVAADEPSDGEALLQPVMREGRLIEPLPDLAALKAFAARQMACLPERLRRLDAADPFWPEVSDRLKALASEVDARADLAG